MRHTVEIIFVTFTCLTRSLAIETQNNLLQSTTWSNPASPSALAISPDGRWLYAACATASRVTVLDSTTSTLAASIDVPKPPLGLAISRDGSRLFAACAAPESVICVIDTATARIVERIPAGHTAMAPVLSKDEKRLFVCNRFNHDVSVIDLSPGKEIKRISVEREPVAAALTPDGSLLLVANHLHSGPASDPVIQSKVSVIDTRSLTVRKQIPLTLGSSLLRGIAVSPDGRFAAVTHLRSLYWLTTRSVEMGRMNCNALSFIDLERLEVMGVLLLDQTARGAANPWDVQWAPDGKCVVVTLAGTHEIALIDAPQDTNRDNFFSMRLSAYEERSPNTSVPSHPVRVRQRIPIFGVGPRALAFSGSRLYVANYFSDDISQIDLADSEAGLRTLALGRMPDNTIERRGEIHFNDARLCSQGWQSCASCHDTDGRTDALNWDLLNDGAGNPKNTRSLLWAYRTGPAMALGVRTNAAEAVRAGIHHILFTQPSEEVPAAIDAFVKSLEPIPSPMLVNGRHSPAAERGMKLFLSAKTGCANCHPPPYYTDSTGYDVGTGVAYHGMWDPASADKASDRFYTPTLVEVWRTAPYLHDGSAQTLRDVLASRNPNDQHGVTRNLTQRELDDLVAYLSSL